MKLSSALILIVITTLVWYVLYRVPFADRRRANRFALILGTRTSLRPDLAFAIFGTVVYVSLGAAGCVLIANLANLSIVDLFVAPLGVESLVATVLALAGAMSLVSVGITVLLTIRPTIDVPGSIRRVRWLAIIEAFPLRMRFSIPMLGALIEETFFRGVVYAAITATGGSMWLAFATTAILFTVGQVIFCDNVVAAVVIGFGSLVISTFGTILVGTYGNVVPALVVHISFAGYYSGVSLYSDVPRSDQ